MAVKTGLDVFLENPSAWTRGERLGLLCNPASVDSKLVHARHRITHVLPGRLTALYSPQHGFFAEKQDNMIESDHDTDPATGLPVFSLYGETRIPTPAMFDPIDTLVVDLQDVGTRVYTFIYTLSYCMEAAHKMGKRVIVLDRPNPIGGQMEGNLLTPDCQSFVGRYPIPMRHGLTIGELAILFNTTFGIQCELDVVPLQGWNRSMMFRQTGLPWVAPSPNMPTPETAMVYPGQVIWEGTQVSEGRGTTQPFEFFGAPFITPEVLLEQLNVELLSGVILRPIAFEPTSNKWNGKVCKGCQIHVTDTALYQPYALSLALYQAIFQLYKDDFAYKLPPYEYEYERLPMDLILGDIKLRQALENQIPVSVVAKAWAADLSGYKAETKKVFLYGDA
ncbi:DUF1343 domain-containing protein [Desulfosarcina sp. OttesenSCG-928-A07]|nr:DUF1343 domain-containing protein [Desulfosarcina sp. OttesenSCG-928-A07]